MSRRDTIIIALLVNASLLALLFLLAINTDDGTIIDHPEITKTIVDTRPSVPVSKQSAPIIIADTTVQDEVDSFLKDLAAEDTSQSLLIDEDSYIELKKETPVVIVKPAPKKEPSISDDENYVEVTVKRGDALEKLARSNGTSVEAIKRANNLNTAKLSIGQVLRIPIGKKIETPVSAKPAPAPVAVSQPIVEKVITNSDVQYYTVKSGDNPWKIAKQFNVKFDDLLKLNNLDEERARNMKIGDKIRVK